MPAPLPLDERQTHELLLTHAPLVRRIASHLAARLPTSVELDDLVQAGTLGLLDAARHYSSGHGASFETYAGIRIRGAMVDELRRGDWAPRSVHRRAREISAAIHAIEQASGQAARDTDVAARLGIPISEYHAGVQDAARCHVISMHASAADPDDAIEVAAESSQPDTPLLQEEFRKALADAIGQLPEKEKMVMSLYYSDELNLREIGAVLGITESRVCQIHGQALLRLRSRLSQWVPEALEA